MVLIFDMDGVLVKSTFFADILVKMICQRFEDYNIEMERQKVFQEILRRFVNKLNEEDKTPAYDWDLIVGEYLSEYKLPWACEIEDVFNSDIITEYSTLYRDVTVNLDWLLEKGFKLALLTNGLGKYQNNIIEKLGIQRYFQKIMMPDPEKIKFVKPHPEIFKEVVEGFPEPYVMIGDSLYFDVYGAKKIGFETIWLARGLPKRYRALPILDRTAEINQKEKYLLRNILRGASFVNMLPEEIEIEEFKPDKIICNLNELRDLFS